jgi:Xaa-Pro aminopeptidase
MNRMIYADSEHNSDLFYATHFLAPDAFLYFEKAGRSYIVLNQLEYDRGAREADADKVINLSDVIDQLKKKGEKTDTANWISIVLKKHGLNRVQVSPSFPIGLGDLLRKKRLHVDVAEDALFPERAIKQKDEIKAIRHSLKVTTELLKAAIHAIQSSRPAKNKVLMLHGKPLTSEIVQSIIRMEASRRGFRASNPIVAGGIQACDPHERGSGKLRANELIIIDIFPKDLKSGYWGDMTRTVVKGRANEAQRKLFNTVWKSQKLAFSKLRAGVDGQSVHKAIDDLFESQGYQTSNGSGRYEGFFHGTGHGLGLDIHESPRVSKVSHKLRDGEVVTVEPGLYYQGIGGVRIEDVVAVKSSGCELLSHCPVRLEI